MSAPARYTVRSLFAALAAAYFLWVALAWVGPGVTVEAMVTDEQGNALETQLTGDDGPLAVTSAVRTVSGGMVLLSLVGIEWAAVGVSLAAMLRRLDGTPPQADA